MARHGNCRRLKRNLLEEEESAKIHVDQLLHKILCKIFRECFHSNNSEIENFLRTSRHILKQDSTDRLNLKAIISEVRFPERYPEIIDLEQMSDSKSFHEVKRLKMNTVIPSRSRNNHVYSGVWSRVEFQVLPYGNGCFTPENCYQYVEQIANPITNLIVRLDNDLDAQIPEYILEKLSLLWVAILGSYHKSAELLVCSGADVNEPFGYHNPQFIDAKSTVLLKLLQMNPSSENESLIHLIVRHGADVQARDSFGRSALHFAVAKGRVQLTEMFLEKGADANVNIADEVCHDTPLLVSANNSKADELLPLLMQRGANVFVKNADGENVLHRLSRGPVEHTDMARVLIKKGVSLDQRDGQQFQPIHRAIMVGHNELVKLYLDHGANVNSLVNDDLSPLHIAARNEKPTVLKTLLKRGANIHHKSTSTGHTALHVACRYFREENIKILLSAGADTLIEDCAGNTPVALMISRINVEHPSIRMMIVKLLALLKGRLQSTIALEDEQIIERDPKLWDHYRACIEQIERAKSTRFFGTCTFFDLLVKCHCQLSALMRNPEFESNFKLYDLSKFSTYADDIVRAFESAQKLYHSMLEQEDVINEAVYDTLPYMVVRRMIHYICDCCVNVK